jgi:hypothetical protein
MEDNLAPDATLKNDEDFVKKREDLNFHLFQVVCDLEWGFGLRFDLVNSDALGDFLKCETIDRADVEDGKVGDDGRYAFLACERECALVEDLGVALLVGVLHGDDDLGLGRVGYEVHSAADTLDLSRKHEVGEICVP